MFTWIYTGETTTRRVRENYLQAILRQNIAFFDRLGPGEVTTRIETDTHLIQEGISDKIAISVFFIAIFIAGFVIAVSVLSSPRETGPTADDGLPPDKLQIIRNWRLALVCSTIIPCIAVAGGVMNSFISKYKQQQLEETANGATLAEEVIASVRSAHAFGNQKRLADMYNEANERT
jgi:ATP-binding cassette subfamily B (MDR/TAP) protein 1